MKKNIIYKTAILLSILFVGGAATSCDSFLNRQEDEQMTFEKIWQKVATTQQYFFQCMGYLPKDSQGLSVLANLSGSKPIDLPGFSASDEAMFSYQNQSYNIMNFGSWNASNLPNDNINFLYEGIRDCNIFLQNVMSCSDPQAVVADLQLWYNCVRFARAYYYFLLMRDYGPVIMVGDELLDQNASLDALARRRSSWEECVNYVVSEMTEVAKSLQDSYASAYQGLPTRGAALAVISRLKLYSARPLFNGNALYRNVGVNDKGEPLFPQEFDAHKWVEAAQAAKAVIDMGLYTLYKDESNDPYLNYSGIILEPWNTELIFTSGGFSSGGNWATHTRAAGAPTGTAYGGWGPTQQHVDAYAMASGRYPITGYESDGTPIIDPESGYRTDEFTMQSNFANPYLVAIQDPENPTTTTANTPMMYVGREPRFYVSVYWSGGVFRMGETTYNASFAQGGNGHVSHDYGKAGYLVNRYYDHTQPSTSYGCNITYPTFRLGEIYLNYIEAVLECERYGVSGEGVDHATAMRLWAELRQRSGLGDITAIYPEAVASAEYMRELVKKERRIELAFEGGHRYYDARTWMIAEQVMNGPMYGMDTTVSGSGSTVPEDFWKRVVIETHVFKKQHYMFPFPQRELDRNRLLDNNYGW